MLNLDVKADLRGQKADSDCEQRSIAKNTPYILYWRHGLFYTLNSIWLRSRVVMINEAVVIVPQITCGKTIPWFVISVLHKAAYSRLDGTFAIPKSRYDVNSGGCQLRRSPLIVHRSMLHKFDGVCEKAFCGFVVPGGRPRNGRILRRRKFGL